MTSRIERAALFTMRRLFRGVATDYEPLRDWPRDPPASWTGPAATRRFMAGERGARTEGLDGNSDDVPLAARDALQLLAATGLQRAEVLDFGCGNALYRDVLARFAPTKDWTYSGCDVNPGLVESCRRRLPGTRFERSEPSGRMPFEDASFDVVLASGVLHCVDDTLALLSELRRVTRQWALLSRVPVRKYTDSGIYRQRVWHAWGFEEHPIRIFKRDALEAVCARAGFELVQRDWGVAWFNVPNEDEPAADMLLLLSKAAAR